MKMQFQREKFNVRGKDVANTKTTFEDFEKGIQYIWLRQSLYWTLTEKWYLLFDQNATGLRPRYVKTKNEN